MFSIFHYVKYVHQAFLTTQVGAWILTKPREKTGIEIYPEPFFNCTFTLCPRLGWHQALHLERYKGKHGKMLTWQSLGSDARRVAHH